MGVTFTLAPTDAHSVAGCLHTISADVVHDSYIAPNASGTFGLIEVALYYRVNGGLFSVTKRTCAYTESETISYTLRNLRPGDRVDWLATAVTKYSNAPGPYDYNSATQYMTVAADSSGPTFASVLPADAASSIPPVAISATIADPYGVESVALWWDGVKVREVLALSSGATYYDESYGFSWTVSSVPVGAVSWYLKATDINGNESTLATRTFTAQNAPPTTPGIPVVSGAVGQGGSVTVTWGAASDYNGDALTYTLQEKYGAGAYAEVASGITSPSYVWSPSTAGAAYLSVAASDGTALSGYAESALLYVYPNTAPNAPTITAPAGGATWTEGETQSVTWTEASPRDDDGHTVTYEIEFSAAGTFADAVAVVAAIAQGVTTYAWSLPATLVAADTATCKVRVRARDQYNGISSWSTSAAFNVIENACPIITLVSPTANEVLTDSTPTITVEITDADSDKLHVEIEISELADFSSLAVNPISSFDQTGWEAAAHPHAVWSAFDAGGEDSGDQARYTVAVALRYDYHYIRARVTDGRFTSDWTTAIRVLVRYSSTDPLYVTIDSTVWSVEECVVTECTGGEPSPIEITLPTTLVMESANPPTRGDDVTVGCNIEGTAKSWGATVEEIRYDGPYVHISCLQDDAYLSRKLATGDVASKDVGQALKDLVTAYGSPLSGAGIDVTSGTTAAITGGYLSLREHFGNWTDPLLRYVFVDATGDITWVDPADLAVPAYVLAEGV